MRKGILFVLILMYVAGCSSLQRQQEIAKRSDRYRNEAYHLYENGDYGLALSKIKMAIKESRSLRIATLQSVESYDDAGLYYYSTGKFKESAYYQAVAVLLAYDYVEFENMFSTYLTRLGWAYKKYRPNCDFREIKMYPLTLLGDEDLNLKDNFHIKKKFYKRNYGSRSYRLKMYILKPKWIKYKKRINRSNSNVQH